MDSYRVERKTNSIEYVEKNNKAEKSLDAVSIQQMEPKL